MAKGSADRKAQLSDKGRPVCFEIFPWKMGIQKGSIPPPYFDRKQRYQIAQRWIIEE